MNPFQPKNQKASLHSDVAWHYPSYMYVSGILVLGMERIISIFASVWVHDSKLNSHMSYSKHQSHNFNDLYPKAEALCISQG